MKAHRAHTTRTHTSKAKLGRSGVTGKFGRVGGEDVPLPALRRSMVLAEAKLQGLIGPQKDKRVSGRVSRKLFAAAKAKAAVTSDNEVIEYALARLAVEEPYGDRLFKHEGKVPADLDLEL